MVIGAILRDEGPYLLEWIAWHRCLGVSAFYLADNGSIDGMTGLLASFDRAGVVTHIPFPGTAGQPPQLPAYAMIATRFAAETDWIAFIDADEFIQPCHPDGPGLAAWLAAFPRAVGAVGLSWAVFGSSGRAVPGAGLVVDRFPRRGPEAFPENTHLKSIVRCRAWGGLLQTPHAFAPVPGAVFVDSTGARLRLGDAERWRSKRPAWAAFRLNHYAIKSRTEFIHKKVARGRSDTFDAAEARNDEYFSRFDANDVSDPPDPAFVSQVKAEMERLRAILSDLAPPQRDLDLALDRIGSGAA